MSTPFIQKYQAAKEDLSQYVAKETPLPRYSLEEHQAMKEEKEGLEEYWHQFPHHADIATMHTKALGQFRYQEDLERKLAFFMVMALPAGMVLQTGVNKEYASRWKNRRFMAGTCLVTGVLVHLSHMLSVQSIHKNRGVYGTMPHDTKLKRVLDRKYDLYHKVEEIKKETGLSRGEYREFLSRTTREREKRLEEIYHTLGL